MSALHAAIETLLAIGLAGLTIGLLITLWAAIDLVRHK